MQFKEALKKFIQENLVRDSKDIEIDENESLIERGVIDSMGLLSLITFIEGYTGIRVPDEEVLLENFMTISTIQQTVERLRARGMGSSASTA